jgi:MoaA/NifB/PqqE/SkfB family radical SAM enzyme
MTTQNGPLTAWPATIELHFSNRCSGDCVVCSKAHGGHRPPLMTDQVFLRLLDRLAETGQRFQLQLGGDGDAFLHPHFLEYCRQLKRRLPDSWRCLYTSGFSLSPGRAWQIHQDQLLDELQIRIDSLDPATYCQSTGMLLTVVLGNLAHFVRINTHAKVCVIYLPLYLYRRAVRQILAKEPTYFARVDQSRLRDEWPAVKAWADELGIESRVTGLSLWGERTDCAWSDHPCPRLPENRPGDFARQLYIYPNGDYGACPYDDAQDTFLVGNVFEDSIADVWRGPRWQAVLDRIRGRTAQDHPPCCVNARACTMWEPWEIPLRK